MRYAKRAGAGGTDRIVLKLSWPELGGKVDLRISRKMGLFLAMAVEQSLLRGEPANLMKRIASKEGRVKLQELAGEILQKAEAEEFYGLVKKIAER